MIKLIKQILILPIRFYRLVISPSLVPTCRFVPTCSDYSMDAFRKFGPFKGLFLTIKRIVKCHPFHKGGYDPLPVTLDEVQIEISGIENSKDIFDLVNKAYLVEKGDQGVAFKNCDRYGSVDEVKKHLGEENCLICRVESGEIVGCVFFSNVSDIGHFGPFAVDPDYQKLGIGRLLISEVVRRLKILECRKIEIEVVDTRTDLLEYYKKRDFAVLRQEESISVCNLDNKILTRDIKILVLQKKI